MRALAALGAAAVLGAGLGACTTSAGADPQPHQETVVVTVRHSRFRPDRLSFAPGATVRFVVRNRDPIDHEFLLGDDAVQRRHERGREAHHGDRPGEVSVAAGSEAVTTYTFGERGTVLYGCHLPGHWAYGMRGTVRVTK